MVWVFCRLTCQLLCWQCISPVAKGRQHHNMTEGPSICYFKIKLHARYWCGDESSLTTCTTSSALQQAEDSLPSLVPRSQTTNKNHMMWTWVATQLLWAYGTMASPPIIPMKKKTFRKDTRTEYEQSTCLPRTVNIMKKMMTIRLFHLIGSSTLVRSIQV